MSDLKDFVIRKGILSKYTGNEDNVIIPDSVTEIKGLAFLGCRNIKSITIPNSVAKIGERAFCNCESLISVTIPESVTNIGWNAFGGCTKLKSVVMKNNVENVDTCAFHKCKGLADKNGFVIVSNVLYDYFGTKESIEIPDTVTKISQSAFEKCKDLKNVQFPDTVLSIEVGAFCECENLTEIVLPASIENIGIGAFRRCTNLKSITFGRNLKAIGANAFSECDNLCEIKISAKSEKLQGEIFDLVWKKLDDAQKIRILFFMINNKQEPLLSNQKITSKIKLQKDKLFLQAVNDDNTEIIEYVLSLNKTPSLEEIDRYINIANGAPNITAFLLDYKNRNYSSEKQEKFADEKVEKELGIKEKTLSDWKKVFLFEKSGDELIIKGYKGNDETVIIPENIGVKKITQIAKDAFSTTAPRITDKQKQIRKNIKTVIVPKGIVNIGYGAFSGCLNLTSITLPKGIRKIGFWAFLHCGNLEYVYIPKSVRTIESSAFSNCFKLVIHAPAGSYAEQYAKENNIPFVAE